MTLPPDRPTILLVDDAPENIEILGKVLADYRRIVALDGTKALAKARSDPSIDLILLDIIMPGLDGYEVCRQLKADPQTRHIPVIFITALSQEDEETKGFTLGAVDYITKPFKAAVVKQRVMTHLELKQHQDHLERLVKERTRELALVKEATIESLATLAEYRDPETGGHIKRTQSYVRILAQALGERPHFTPRIDASMIELLVMSAPLHDIGKVGVPDHILLKPGRLTADEFETMKKHTLYGYQAILAAEKKIAGTAFFQMAREIIYTHHEKWDGTGYPCGLAGETIPLAGRIMALADVYDALISKRTYKRPMPHEEAVRIISAGRGNHFDPEMVDVFLTRHTEFHAVALQFADFNEERDLLATCRLPRALPEEPNLQPGVNP